ncbi:MAG: P1 family peptidase, partial [Pseudomonadota bacterium]
MTTTPLPGPRNALTDVAGLMVGHAEDHRLLTGVTAVIAERPMRAAISVMGGGAALRSDGMGRGATVAEVDGVVLSGGSAFGLDAPGGAMDWLRREGRGLPVRDARIPIVPGAIIFDLGLGASDWSEPPWWRLGREAAAASGPDFALGNAGAGLGATAGPLKGGLGTASIRWGAFTVAALAVANPMGSAVIPGSRHFWAWDVEEGAEFGGLGPPTAWPEPWTPVGTPHANTTLVVVATDAALDRSQAERLALMAQDGLARAIRPVHSPMDGDTVFALASGDHPLGRLHRGSSGGRQPDGLG